MCSVVVDKPGDLRRFLRSQPLGLPLVQLPPLTRYSPCQPAGVSLARMDPISALRNVLAMERWISSSVASIVWREARLGTVTQCMRPSRQASRQQAAAT
jgi:hypothetical protein